jgi:cold shock CspA family protein
LHQRQQQGRGIGRFQPATQIGGFARRFSAVQKAGYSDLVEGARISYELVPNPPNL